MTDDEIRITLQGYKKGIISEDEMLQVVRDNRKFNEESEIVNRAFSLIDKERPAFFLGLISGAR